MYSSSKPKFTKQPTVGERGGQMCGISQFDSVSSPGANIYEQHGRRIPPPGIPDPNIVQPMVFSSSFSSASIPAPKHLSLTISAPAAPIPVPTQVTKRPNTALTSGEGCKAEECFALRLLPSFVSGPRQERCQCTSPPDAAPKLRLTGHQCKPSCCEAFYHKASSHF